MGAISVRIEVEPRDLWLGVYIPEAGGSLYQSVYICFPLPVFPVHVRWMRQTVNWRRPWDAMDRATRSMATLAGAMRENGNVGDRLTRSMADLARAAARYGETNANESQSSGN
jgi:hypothetical protein